MIYVVLYIGGIAAALGIWLWRERERYYRPIDSFDPENEEIFELERMYRAEEPEEEGQR